MIYKSINPKNTGVMGFILYTKITGKRRKRGLEESFDPWDIMENLEMLAFYGNF